MGKVKRGKSKDKKKEKVKIVPMTKSMCIGHEYIQPGCVVKMKRIPDDIKKDGKKLKEKKVAKLGFVPDSEHVIQKPPKNRVNTLASVYLKGKDGKLYQIAFPFYILTRKDKDGNFVPGVIDRYEADKKKAQKNLEEPKKKKKKKKSK